MTIPMINVRAFVKPHWSDQEKANATAALEFVQLLMNEHNFEQVLKQYKGVPYKQHNRTMADGIDGVVTALRNLVKRSPDFSYEVKRVFVDSDQVILHSHATLKAADRGDYTKGLNIIDTWTVKDGKLVEHWDAVQGLDFSMRLYGLMTGGRINNSNGVF